MASKNNIINNKSPFSNIRYELGGKPLYFLPKSFYVLENSKNCFVIGSRGTGKTTLLRALSWKERLENEYLKRELNSKPFKNKFIGIYLKVPEYNLLSIYNWLAKEKSIIKESIFSIIFDLIWIEEGLSAISELAIKKIIKISPENEQDIINDIYEYFRNENYDFVKEEKISLRGMSKIFRRIKNKVIRNCYLGIIGKDLIDSTPFLCNPKVGINVAKILASSIEKYDGNRWFFKICLDEAESLVDDHKIYLNTMIRNGCYPVYYAISYVSRTFDMMSTTDPHLTLSTADRDIIKLDEMKDIDFQELACGVTSVRLRENIKRYKYSFNAEKLLGSIDINKLLYILLKRSESKKAKDLIDKGFKLKALPFFINNEYKQINKNPLIYEAYLVDKMKLRLPSSSDPRWKRRSQSSREIRKRMVAAYLSICNEYRTDIIYASAEMLYQMSDNCIRDFLNQMDRIFNIVNKPAEVFIKSKIPIELQDRAFKEASQNKWDSLPELIMKRQLHIGAIVDGLAKITAIIQSKDIKAIISSERGKFNLKRKTNENENDKIKISNIRDASEAGFLKILEMDEKTCIFRVHCSLAAKYGFSYRGAYYDVPITYEEIDMLIKEKEVNQSDAINYIIDGISGEDNKQMSLPGL